MNIKPGSSLASLPVLVISACEKRACGILERHEALQSIHVIRTTRSCFMASREKGGAHGSAGATRALAAAAARQPAAHWAAAGAATPAQSRCCTCAHGSGRSWGTAGAHTAWRSATTQSDSTAQHTAPLSKDINCLRREHARGHFYKQWTGQRCVVMHLEVPWTVDRARTGTGCCCAAACG